MEQLGVVSISDGLKEFVVPIDKSSINRADYLNTDLENSFKGPSQAVLLKPGLKLWRFCSKKDLGYYSDCWIDCPTMDEMMSSFRAAGIFGFSYKNRVIRNNLAIMYRWNSLHFRTQIELKQSLAGHIGIIGSQKAFIPVKAELIADRGAKIEKFSEHWVGGHIQYVIPRLKRVPRRSKENSYAKVVHFAEI